MLRREGGFRNPLDSGWRDELLAIAVECRQVAAVPIAILERVALLDELFAEGESVLGRDLLAYRNHAYRVFNLSRAFIERPDASTNDRIAAAAYFHDVGIWTDATFDYLAPSAAHALAWLARTGRDAWSSEISRMISEHHKLTRCREPEGEIVEAFRRADWTDVTLGLRRFGADRGFVTEVRATFPNAGFHRRLAELGLRRCRTHPLSPLPMLRF